MLTQDVIRRALFTICILCCFCFYLSLSAYPGQQAKKNKNGQSAAAQANHVKPDAAQFVGTETCQACHEEVHKTFIKGPHWVNDKAKKVTADVGQGCESCHGPGKAHAEDPAEKGKIRNLLTMARGKSSATCESCHQNTDEHINFQRSVHNNNKVGCVDCHSAHQSKTPEFLLKAATPQLCYQCHSEVKADFLKPFRHRVQEKLITCSDCHNPHGGFNSKQTRATASQDAGCFRCHSEKAGPYVFEHAPVKTEGCVACHTPHGSTNPRMLKRSNVNLLCLECHTLTVDSAAPAAPSFHNQAQKYQACTMCHTAIHGSNFSSVFFK
ncbi:MAG: DmsE family decaheme c-type cytochrome [Terriglobales bacterium]